MASREEASPPRDTPNEAGAFAVHHRGMLACHECDALQRRVPLQSGGMARCVRCGAVLYRRSRHGLEVTLALTFTAAVLFLLANAFPIVSLELQEKEFAAAERGFTAVKHQREVGTGYFDAVTTTIEREASTAALKGSTEDEQFFDGTHH